MGMKLKSGADLCGFQLTNFCVQGEASAPSDAALGRKYFHTNATDDVATGISLLNRERIYLGEGAWRATAYLDDIAAINEKLNLITGDTDTDTLINNLKDLEEFLKDFSETDKLKSLLDGKLDKSGGTIEGDMGALRIKRNLANMSAISFENTNGLMGYLGFYRADTPAVRMSDNATTHLLIHSGNSTSYNAGGLAHSNGTIGAVVNSSGNVTIGGSDLAGTLPYAKLCIDGVLAMPRGDGQAVCGVLGFSEGDLYLGYSNTSTYNTIILGKNIRLSPSDGNVLIGTTNDNGAKLQVDGSSHFLSYIDSSTATQLGSRIPKSTMIGADKFGLQVWGQGDGITRMQVGRIDGQATAYDLYLQPLGGNVRIFGNLIVDGEVSAGGAGAEEGTSGGGGSVDFHSEDFTPSTSTTYQVNHNLGKKVIVQVYEQGATSETWNLVMVDVEIISATRLDLRFGKIEDTPHRVVVMGAGV